MTSSNKHKTATPIAPIDFVIITALEEERVAMLSKLRGYKKLDKKSDDIYTYYYAEVKSQRNDGAIYQVIVGCPINMGPINATALSVTLVKRWNPQFVLLVGIACGVKGEVNYGDVMIATQVADYTLAKQINGKREVRWDVFPSGSSLLDSANNIDSKWVNQIRQSRPSLGNVAKVKGVIASGGDVISDDEVIKSYSDSWPKLIGIEMESGGVAAGVHQTPERPEFLMIKSVSDFGKDKHEPEVKPWRNYACHASAAFALGLIKSGPFQSSILIKESSKKLKEEDERKEAAERRWQYIQSHPITNIEILFFLKLPVGYDWLISLFDDIHIFFSREKSNLKLSHVLKKSPEPNRKEYDRKSNMPNSSFWEIYEHEEGYWCKRINPVGRSFNLVAGFDASIPWSFINIPEIISLQDLATCDEIGISFPPQIFQAGIEEIILRINGETYSFSIYISDNKSLEFYHKMVNTFFSMGIKGGEPINFAMGFQGVQLLEMFHKQMMPGYKRACKKEEFMMGQSSPKGNAISFYPSMPKGFHTSKESEEFSFTITGPKEIDYENIEKDLQKNIATKKNELDNYLKLASLYSIQGRFQDVIKLLTTTNFIKPNSDLHGILASAYANLGRYKEALAEFKNAESLTPDNPDVQSSLGLCFEELGEHETALEHFTNAVSLEPSNSSYQYNLAKALAMLNRTSEAITHARNAVNLAPDEVENVITLGVLLQADGQDDEALSFLEKSVQIDSKSARAYRYYAKILVHKGEVEKAIENFEHSIKLKKDVDCYADLGQLLCYINRWSEAESVIQEGLLIDSNHYSLLVYLGVAKANQGNLEEAKKLLEKAHEIDPKDKTAIEILEQVTSHL